MALCEGGGGVREGDPVADVARVCVVGAGAIGGYLGASLAAAGCVTSAVARNATLSALREHGWRLRTAEGLVTAPVRASDDPAELGPQDVVVISVKAPALPDVAARLAPLLGPETVVVAAMNGVPWWFFDGSGGAYAGLRPASADPGGAMAAAVETERVIGCVVHAACSVPEPGVVQHGAGRGFILGEPDGTVSDRVSALAGLLRSAGLEPTVSTAIRADVWYKLWGNMTMNPVSVLTGATSDLILDDPLVNGFCQAVMTEAARIGAKIGCPVEQSPADRNAITRGLGAMRTSMLQDAEAGKPLELDALLTAVREIAQAVGEPAPMVDALLGLTRLNARVRDLYPW
jgi:2-dehydropantoate 2-reductase